MSSPTEAIEMVNSLSDDQAVRALALVLRYRGTVPDPALLREAEDHLREAAADPSLTEYRDPGDGSDAGALSRAALIHLAASDPEVIERAVYAAEEVNRYDAVSIAVGGLVLLALQTEVELTRNEKGRWRLHIHKKAMRDSTLGRLLTKLISLYGPGGK
ncbi:MAG: hypothetical protein AUI14_19820 [Actinobacteria bacterium 13_2_20CM_2_71_6]|nr:MAG: hypothetical protein AUI14_19820 [Actinobacteria bacterium 13_2_20CM_2_71_6]